MIRNKNLLLLASLCIAIGYGGMYYTVQKAYFNEKHNAVAKLTKQYNNILPGMYQIAMKSAIEHCITVRLKENTFGVIDPTLRPFFFNLERYIAPKVINDSNEKWIAFYRELKKYDVLDDFYNLGEKKYIYTILAEKASKLNFRKKEMYIQSCYMYTFASQLKVLQHAVAELSVKEKNTSQITEFMKKINSISLELDKGIQKIEQSEKNLVTRYYYDQMENIFYDVISANHNKYNTLTNNSLKKNIGRINRKLFSYLQRCLHDREEGKQTLSGKREI